MQVWSIWSIFLITLGFNTMPKKQHDLSDEDQQPEDIRAWGNRRENYYQQGEDDYSSSGEEQNEAEELYQRQLKELGHQDVYEVPQEDADNWQEDQDEDDNDQTGAENTLSHAYLTKEIAKTAKMGLKLSEEADSTVRKVLETEIQAYLMTLIGLRDLKIPYIEFHPLFNKSIEMKQEISQLKRLLDTSTLQEESNEDEDEFEEEEGEYFGEEGEEDFDQENYSEEEQVQQRSGKGRKRETDANIEEGLKIYAEAKQQHVADKAALKQEKRKERDDKKRPAFLLVKDKEGRLASEKILKNKGLIKRRKKIDRNSRVKHRRKFQKAQSKRRAYGHVIRENPGREYEGERNIRYGRIASTKLK